MKKLASIVIALAFVMGTVTAANAQDAACQYDVVGITTQNPWAFNPDGWVTFNRTNWYEDDIYACYYTSVYPQYYPYFSACDFNGDGEVTWEGEVKEMYLFILEHPWPSSAASHAYQCPADECPDDPNKTEPGICGCGTPDTDSDGDGVADCVDPCPQDNPDDPDGDGVCGVSTGGWDDCPADMPAYYDPAPGAHDVDSVEWAANGACNEFYTENNSGQSVCTQAQTNSFLADINGILANPDYDFTNAVFDGVNGGYQTYRTSTSSILCGVPGVMLPISFFDEIDSCWHGGPSLDGSMVMRFDWHVNYDAALDSYLAYIQETYPDAFCETSGLSGAPTGFHAVDVDNGWKEWTVRATANCDYYGCRCEATLNIYANGAGTYSEISKTNDSIFYMYQGMMCEDQRFNF